MLNNIIDFPPNLKHKQKAITDDLRKNDVESAIEKTMALIDEGHVEGYYFAALMYEMKKDFDNAKFYYEKAIEQYRKDIAYLGLAGLHVIQCAKWCDYEKAFDLYKKVAEKSSNAANKGFANFMLGKMYYFGTYVTVDYKVAKQYFEKGWDSGHIMSLTFLGLTEQKLGNYFKGWKLRLKASCYAIPIIITNRKWKSDPRLRGIK